MQMNPQYPDPNSACTRAGRARHGRPFHYDPNELPLPAMQYKLNERLLAVTQTERPVAFADVDHGVADAAPAAGATQVRARASSLFDVVLE
jgi:hypothetical protein